MKNLIKTFLFALTLTGYNSYSQQLVRATDIRMVSEAGTKIVLTGGITFTGTSDWLNNGDTYLYKTTATSPEGWLDSTGSGVLLGTSTGNVFFNGSFRQSFYGKTKFYDLTIRNTFGDTLLSSCEVKNILHLDTGFVFTKTGYGNDSMLVSNTAIAAIVSTSNFSKSWVRGRLSRKANVLQPATYLFPIGKTDSLFAPVKFAKFNTNNSTWTAEYFVGVPYDHNTIMSPPVNHISWLEYWEINSNTQSTPDENAKLSLSWRGPSHVSATAGIRDSLLVAQYINAPPFRWDVPGGWVTGNTVGADSLFGYVTNNTLGTGFSYLHRRFTLGTFSKYNSLPIKLIYFTAIGDGNKVRLNWDVANEQDTKYYEVEKSLTATNFTHLATVMSLRANQSLYTDYDYTPAMGWNYYRLKIFDMTGNFTYSPVRAVKFNKGLEEIRVFPNPTSDILNIQLPSSYINNTTLQVYGIDGKFISSIKPTVNTVQLNVMHLPAATYILQILKKDGSQETYRFVKHNN